MRQTIFRYGLLLSTLAVIAACSKDDDDAEPDITPTNELSYDGRNYALTQGAYDDYGTDPDETHYNVEFHLFELPEGDSDVVPVYLYLDLFSSSTERLVSGTYPFMMYDESAVSGKHYFDEGHVIFNMRLSTEEAEEYQQVEGGTVKVAGTAPDYKIEFDLLLVNGKRVVGSYGDRFENLDDYAAAGMPTSRTIQLVKKERTAKQEKLAQ